MCESEAVLLLPVIVAGAPGIPSLADSQRSHLTFSDPWAVERFSTIGVN